MRQQSRHIHSAHHHFVLSYPVSLAQRFYTIVLGPLAIVALVYIIARYFPFSAQQAGEVVSFPMIILAAMETCARLVVAYVLAVIVAIPLAILATRNSTAESILLPVFDILESVPILALFPVIIMLFINFNSLNGAAIFILFLSMLWNIVFTLVGGLKIIPQDIMSAAHIFGIRGLSFYQTSHSARDSCRNS